MNKLDNFKKVLDIADSVDTKDTLYLNFNESSEFQFIGEKHTLNILLFEILLRLKSNNSDIELEFSEEIDEILKNIPKNYIESISKNHNNSETILKVKSINNGYILTCTNKIKLNKLKKYLFTVKNKTPKEVFIIDNEKNIKYVYKKFIFNSNISAFPKI